MVSKDDVHLVRFSGMEIQCNWVVNYAQVGKASHVGVLLSGDKLTGSEAIGVLVEIGRFRHFWNILLAEKYSLVGKPHMWGFC